MNSAAIKSILAEDPNTVFWYSSRYNDYRIESLTTSRSWGAYPVRIAALGQRRRTREWTHRNDGVLIQYLNKDTLEPQDGHTDIVTARTILGTEAERLVHQQEREVAAAAREAEREEQKKKAETLATLLPQAVKSADIRAAIIEGAGDHLEEVFTMANTVEVDLVAMDGGAQYLVKHRGSTYHLTEVPEEVVKVWAQANSGQSWQRQKNIVAGHLITPLGTYTSQPADSTLASVMLALAVAAGL